MTKATENPLRHPGEAVEFEFEKGQAFKLAGEDDPEEYWYVLHRIWNYDPRTRKNEIAEPWDYKQYIIGEVSTLGGNERTIKEIDLSQNYEPVPKDQAEEVL